MKFRKIIVTTLVLFVPVVIFFFAMHSIIRADSPDEPYSIVILAGQSWAEGTSSYRFQLPAGNGFTKHDAPGDTETGLWWAGADGRGPADTFEFLNMFFNGQGVAGWAQSGGSFATGAARLKNMNDTQRLDQFGPELGVSRELYAQGRRKVIVLKVSYGFQSLAKSNSAFVPFDFNPEPGRNRSYQRMQTEFSALTNYLHQSGQTYTVDGFYWIQGGTDALQDDYAAAYQTNLTNLFNSVRTDFQLHPAAHIVAAKMSMLKCIENSYPLTIYNYCGFPYEASIDPLVFGDLDTTHANFAARVKQVRDAIQTVSDSDQNNPVKVDAVEMNDIPIASDYIHDSEQGNLIFGQRFARMYKLPYRLEGSTDYDGDLVLNVNEDTGRGASCQLSYNAAGNGNLGDDDTDCDGYPNYLDRVSGPGSGLSQ